MSRARERSNGMVCRTIDSLLGKFCYHCGTEENVSETNLQGHLGYCICPLCAEAERLDAIDDAALEAEVSRRPVFLRELAEKLRHLTGTYDGTDDANALLIIARALEDEMAARNAPILYTTGITV